MSCSKTAFTFKERELELVQVWQQRERDLFSLSPGLLDSNVLTMKRVDSEWVNVVLCEWLTYLIFQAGRSPCCLCPPANKLARAFRWRYCLLQSQETDDQAEGAKCGKWNDIPQRHKLGQKITTCVSLVMIAANSTDYISWSYNTALENKAWTEEEK